MKKLFFAAVFLLSIGVFVNAQEVRYLSTQDFKDCIFDYTTNSEWQYKGEQPCIIDFYTTWCGPCKRLAPIMEELAKEYDGKVIFYKVDTERERELAGVFRISSIPQILFIPMTGQPQIIQGLQQKSVLQQVIQELFYNTKK